MSSRPVRKVKPSTVRARSRNKKLAVIGIIAAIAVIAVAFVMYSQGNSANNITPTPTPSTSASPSTSPSGPTRVLLHTSAGDITIQLRDDMPITTANFKNLVQQGIYNGTIFHRVIPNFMIQGGDPTGTGFGDSSIPNIQDEFSTNSTNNQNTRGTIAMANTGQPNSGSSQFFISVVYNSHLDNKHPVFGDVIAGMDVVDAISNAQRDANDKPLQNITIISASILP
jgi:peptidylprolyl isomerase